MSVTESALLLSELRGQLRTALERVAKRDADLKASSDAWHAQEEELQRLREELARIKRHAEKMEGTIYELRGVVLEMLARGGEAPQARESAERARNTLQSYGADCPEK